MYDAGKVATGLVILLLLITTPFWLRVVRGQPAGPDAPKLELPTDAKQCVAATEYMRTSHMQLLNTWRNDVVRHDDRYHVAPDGKPYEKSLSRTCMSCHSNKAEFCDRCHEYSSVANPYCWDCHVEPKEAPDGNG